MIKNFKRYKQTIFGLKKKINKVKVNFIYNILSFCIFLGSQQLILMPIISKKYSETLFSETIFNFTIVTFFGCFMVYSLGDTFLAKLKDNKDTIKIFESIFRIIIIIILLCLFICTILFAINYIILLFVLLLSFLRIWSEFIYRYEEKYEKILQQNIFYFVGSLLILLPVDNISNDPMIHFFVAEIFSLIIYYKKIFKLFMEEFLVDKNILKDYTIYSLQYGLHNIIDHGDRLFLYTLFSPYMLNSYYALTVSSKCLYLFITPVRAVLASMMAKKNDSEKNYIIDYLFKISKKSFVILFVCALLSIFFAMYFLYNIYLDDNLSNIAIVALATSIGCLSYIYHMVCMRYVEANRLLYISIFRLVLLIIIGYPLTTYFKIKGFLISLVILNIAIMACYFTILRKLKQLNVG